MTTEEAIKTLELINLDRIHPFLNWEEMMEVRDMAIFALRAQQFADDAIEGLCCDCHYGGPCCDFSENEGCEHHRSDGSCRVPHRPAKPDRSRWEGCGYCSDPEDAETNEFLFCPYCGRPLTEEAWAESERRIGGNDGTADN